jgi:hypothetical protein
MSARKKIIAVEPYPEAHYPHLPQPGVIAELDADVAASLVNSKLATYIVESNLEDSADKPKKERN